MPKYLQTKGVAAMTGLTVSTVYTYLHHGIMPGPRERIGNVGLFDARDVRAWMASRSAVARPGIRKSVRAGESV
jgi:predicted DNA-binding transcriptional regulator AlpA